MSTCDDIRELIPAVLDREATTAETELVQAHVADCSGCADVFEAMSMVVGAGDFLADVDPPRHLGEEIAASPCRRWLGLLHQAVDRDISSANLERLLAHLEGCPNCRRAWHDLTLIHQVSDAMRPPNYLLEKCIRVRHAVARIAILPRRTATAAAYVLALLASIAIGNPTIIAQDLQAVAAERVGQAASGVTEVAAQGRGEARVALWRAMCWGESKIDAVRSWIDRLGGNGDDAPTGDNAVPDTEPQGDSS